VPTPIPTPTPNPAASAMLDALAGHLQSVPFLAEKVLGNTVLAWLVAFAVAVLGYLGLRVVVALVRRRLARLAERTVTIADDLIVELVRATKGLFLAIVSLAAGAQFLTLPPSLERGVGALFAFAVTIQAVLWANRTVSFWLERQQKLHAETDPGAMTTLQGLSYVVRVVVWSAAFLLLLDNLGYNVTTLIAGLGVGGVAVALAVQNILGDLFASLSIVLDKPFVNGDFIIIDQHMGTVERIGLKTTRVRSLSGEQIVVSNSDLLKSRVRNFKRMIERRVLFSVGVTYQTPREQVAAIPGMIREIIEGVDNTRFDRSHFKEFGDSSLNFETVYYVLSPDYAVYMDIQQTINLEIMKRFEELGIEIAYPTRTLFLAGGTVHAEPVPAD
jgi:small-conductance mechanosensitive channel